MHEKDYLWVRTPSRLVTITTSTTTFSGRRIGALQKRITINAPVVYMARDVGNDSDAGNIHYEGHWKGWALKSRLFWALKWQQAKRVQYGPKKHFSNPGQINLIP
jgi:hypothetical protein